MTLGLGLGLDKAAGFGSGSGSGSLQVNPIGAEIVIDTSLQIYLEGANASSLNPSDLSAWNDMSGNGYNFDLSISQPVYDAGNGGAVVFYNYLVAEQIGGAEPNNTGGASSSYTVPSISNSTGDFTWSWWGYFIDGTGSWLGCSGMYVDYYGLHVGSNTFSFSSPLQVWTHWSVTKSGDTWNVYQNGTLIVSTTVLIRQHLGTTFYLNNHAANDALCVKLGQVLVYNRALSDTEILQNYNASSSRFQSDLYNTWCGGSGVGYGYMQSNGQIICVCNPNGYVLSNGTCVVGNVSRGGGAT